MGGLRGIQVPAAVVFAADHGEPGLGGVGIGAPPPRRAHVAALLPGVARGDVAVAIAHRRGTDSF